MDREEPCIVYAGYYPIYDDSGGFNMIERAKLSYLVHTHPNTIYLQGGTARPDAYPPELRKALRIPPRMHRFSRVRILGNAYFGLYCLLKSAQESRSQRLVCVFLGPEMVPFGLMLKLILGIPFLSYLGDSWLATPRSVVKVGRWRYHIVCLLERLAALADAVVLFNPTEVEGLKGLGFEPSKVRYIPAGWMMPDGLGRLRSRESRIAVRKELGLDPESKLVAFHGHMAYQNNIVGAVNISKEIAPRLLRRQELTFLILGGTEKDIPGIVASPNLVLVSYVADRPRLLKYLAAADLYLVPIEIGTGVKTKVLDALSVGLPVIATPHVAGAFTAEGCPIVTVRLDAMPAIIERLVDNPALAESIGRESYAYMLRNYSVSVYHRLDELVSELAGAITGKRDRSTRLD